MNIRFAISLLLFFFLQPTYPLAQPTESSPELKMEIIREVLESGGNEIMAYTRICQTVALQTLLSKVESNTSGAISEKDSMGRNILFYAAIYNCPEAVDFVFDYIAAARESTSFLGNAIYAARVGKLTATQTAFAYGNNEVGLKILNRAATLNGESGQVTVLVHAPQLDTKIQPPVTQYSTTKSQPTPPKESDSLTLKFSYDIKTQGNVNTKELNIALNGVYNINDQTVFRVQQSAYNSTSTTETPSTGSLKTINTQHLNVDTTLSMKDAFFVGQKPVNIAMDNSIHKQWGEQGVTTYTTAVLGEAEYCLLQGCSLKLRTALGGGARATQDSQTSGSSFEPITKMRVTAQMEVWKGKIEGKYSGTYGSKGTENTYRISYSVPINDVFSLEAYAHLIQTDVNTGLRRDSQAGLMIATNLASLLKSGLFSNTTR